MINSQVRSPISKLSFQNHSKWNRTNEAHTMSPYTSKTYLPTWPLAACLVLPLATVLPHGSPSLIPVPDPCYSSACLATQSVFAEFGLIWEYFKWLERRDELSLIFVLLLRLDSSRYKLVKDSISYWCRWGLMGRWHTRGCCVNHISSCTSL